MSAEFTGFTPAQVAQFREEGYVVAPVFWTEREVAAIRAELDRLVAQGKLGNVATDGDGVTKSTNKVNLQVCPIWPHSDFFRAMPFAPKAIAAVQQLIGDPVILHLDQIFLKPARHGAGTNWHQDNAYFQIPDPLRGTALWTAVHEATAANGTLRVIPRAFSESLEHARDPDSNHHIRCWPDESKAVTVEVPAGGAIFFCYGTPHATGANGTERDRAGVALHFLNGDQVGRAQGGFERGKRPVMTVPEANGGVAEYGVTVAGTWEEQVARSLGE